MDEFFNTWKKLDQSEKAEVCIEIAVALGEEIEADEVWQAINDAAAALCG